MILAIVLILVAAGPAAAQCSLELTDIRDEPASVTSASPNRRVYRFKAVARPGSYDTTLFMNTAGAGLGGHIIGCDSLANPNECIRELSCVRPGSWEIWALATCDGLVERKMLPFEVSDVGPDVEITGVVRLPDSRYRIDALFTLPIGQWPPGRGYYVEHRMPDGTYSSPAFFGTNVLTAAPGDRVGVVYEVCGPSLETHRVAEAHAVIPAPPSVEVAVFDGDGQRAVIGEPAEKLLRVKFTASDPALDLRTLSAVFEVISAPSNATGHGVGATETTIAQTYSAPVAADGTAAATIVAGSAAGPYVVRVKSPMSLTGSEARFTTTALKPDAVGVLKDSPDLADLASSYAVSATGPTTFHSVGLDAAGQKIGPMKCNWSASASGNPSTRGDGALVPSSRIASTSFQPRKAGLMKLTASPVLSKVRSGSADLFITGLFVSVQNTFTPAAPVDDSARFVPGMYPDGTSVALNVMETTGQFISLHIPTGGSKGKATFTVDSTNYPGIAMNYPLNGGSTEDMQFTNGQQSITVDFARSTGDTWTTLLVRDFGASGTIRVSIQSGKSTYALKPLKLPVDADGNGLPDAGWVSGNQAVSTTALRSDEDFDTDPVASGEPANGVLGDGLTAFEEYRGFVAGGTFLRLNPENKDLFIVADAEMLIAPVNALALLTRLPQRTHYLNFAEAAMSSSNDPAADDVRPVVNPNRARIAAATEQRAVRLRARRAAPVLHRTATGEDFPAEFFAAGYTWVDQEDLNTIMDPSTYEISNPNGTQVVEYYPAAFENFAISYHCCPKQMATRNESTEE